MTNSLTYIDLAKLVLDASATPLSPSEIWKEAEQQGLVSKLRSVGKTPINTLSATLYLDTQKPTSIFERVGERPIRYKLKGKSYISISPTTSTDTGYEEKHLHLLLTYFMDTYHEVHTKTIAHQKSPKDKYTEWLHPDIVGVRFLIDVEDRKFQVWTNLLPMMRTSFIKLYSFEIKRKLEFSNLREAFFQAVSNSSWAHEGYLVAAEINKDPEFLDELYRLSNGFGIGIIELSTDDPDDCQILFQAREKEEIDIHTMESLSKNEDFASFLESIGRVVSCGRIYKEDYDKVLTADELRVLFENLKKGPRQSEENSEQKG